MSPEELKEQRRQITKRHYWKHRDRLLAAQKLRRQNDPAHAALIKRRSEMSNPARYIVHSSRCNAKKSGTEHSITVNDIFIPEVCPVFGTPFIRGTPHSMSIDRIDSTKGYIPGNIQIISTKANTMKHNASKEELEMFANWILK